MKFRIYKFESVNSTNDKAIEFIKNKNIELGYIFSNIQRKGRGTRGKKWVSLKGNLFGSIFFPLKKKYPNFYEFTFINAVIIYNVIKSCSKNCSLSLKWPNDILMNKKKVCGILQEVIKINNLNYLIIGIGINLVKNPKIKKINTSNIFKETKVKVKRDILLKKLVKSYEEFFKRINYYKFEDYKKKANSLSIRRDNVKWN